MLFNATHSEELRIAIVDGQNLVDLDIDFVNSESKRGNIYKGRVTKVEPSLEAVFVDYGAPRQGFLSLKDISRNYFAKNQTAASPNAPVKIQDVVRAGDSMIVQVEKDERGNKGAALTTFVSLAGRYLVLLPNNPRGGGISRQIDGDKRSELKEIVGQLQIPEEHSIIARTAGFGQSTDNFQADLRYLINLWKTIEEASERNDPPFLIYQESSLIVRTLRDYLRDDIEQILIDDKFLYENTVRFIKDVMPSAQAEVIFYQDPVPLFSYYQIENQIENAFEQQVQLPNGGEIVIEQTEALVTIDVNSARSTKGADIEETAYKTNLEAVEHIAKQLRVRDIGGLIVIDLIDMSNKRNRRNVEKRFMEAVESDRARTRVGRISQFGLLELSRQRLRSSIEESSHDQCPRCRGRGFIRSVTSTALSVLRNIEEAAMKESTELIHAHLPVDVATFLLNEKRGELKVLEQRIPTRIFVIPTQSIQTPDYKIMRLTAAELDEKDGELSYTLEMPNKGPEIYKFIRSGSSDASPVVNQTDVLSIAEAKRDTPFLKRVAKSLFGNNEPTSNVPVALSEETKPKRPNQQRRRANAGGRNERPNRSQPRGTPQNRERPQGQRRAPSEERNKSPAPRKSRSTRRSSYSVGNGSDVDGNVKVPNKNSDNKGRSRRPSSKTGDEQPRNPRSKRRDTDQDSTGNVA